MIFEGANDEILSGLGECNRFDPLARLRDARSLIGFALFAPFATFLLDQGPLSLVLGLAAAIGALVALQRLADLESGDARFNVPLRNRLRGLLGEELLASRPYRLTAPVTGDWLAVEAQLAAGDLRSAMKGYGGPVLPRSTAPGVVRLREALAASLRQALLRSRAPELMSAWTRSGWGRDDYDMWLAQAAVVPASSPMRALVDGQIARLDRELA